MKYLQNSEVLICIFSLKKAFLKIPGYSQESTIVGVLFQKRYRLEGMQLH